ncbi:MAG: HAD family hydrolase [Rhodospirillaceae bacterium]|nr:HAD family hydrolase [Rhodospirillaceae bacterium]
MRAAIRAVLFDKDGTLFDFHRTWVPVYEALACRVAGGPGEAADRLLELAGRDAVSGRIHPESILGAGTLAQLAELWAGAVGAPDAAALRQMIESYARQASTAHAAPVTDLPALFRRLRGRGLALGVATMDGEAAARAHLAAFGLSGLVDFVCGYDSGHGLKPEAGMVRAFCRATGVPAAAVAVVGDTLHDLSMARAASAGLVVGVLTGASPREALLPHADHVLESIAELEAILG